MNYIDSYYSKNAAVYNSNSSFILTNQIIFIDSQVEDYQTLAVGVKSGIEIVILDRDRNGIEQITIALSQRTNLTTIHIVSHGSPGCLYLGNSQLSLDTLTQYQQDLNTWFFPTPQLPNSPTPQLLLYGCNVAAGDAGEEFINKLHNITGAEIAASSTAIGNATKGGNWELEHQTTSFSANIAFSLEVQEKFSGILMDYKIGNRVWNDIDDSGLIDGSEPGIDGVTVNLLQDGSVIATTTTTDGGYYLFPDLAAGDYVVEIDSSNFDAIQVLENLVSSSLDEANPNDDTDSNDNGLGITPDPTNGIRSGIITLGSGTDEPLNETDLAPGGGSLSPNLGDELSEGTGSNVPETYPGISNGAFGGRDNSTSVLVGGNYTIQKGAEAEGKVVVLNDFSVESGSNFSDLGEAGVGSRVPPEDGTDFLLVGGNLTVNDDFNVGSVTSGNVRYQGTLSGSGTANTSGGSVSQDPNLDLSEYSSAISDLQTKSAYWASLPDTANGTLNNPNWELVFKGDNTPGLYVFNVPGNALDPGFAQQVRFEDMPIDGTTVIINVTGSDPAVLNFGSMVAPDGSQFSPPNDFNSDFAANILWNFPDATDVNLTGGAQFYGSVLVAQSNSTTMMDISGHNGRFITAGDLIQNRDGSEFHNYEFDPDSPLPLPTSGGNGGSNDPDNEANLTVDFGFSTSTSSNPTVELSLTPETGGETDTTVFTITATASAAVSGAQTIDLGITGVDVADYDLSDTTITIADGETTGSVTLTAIDDSEDEGDETATVTLDNLSAGLSLGTITTADLVIEDNDSVNLIPQAEPDTDASAGILNINLLTGDISLDIVTGNVLNNDALGDTPTIVTAASVSQGSSITLGTNFVTAQGGTLLLAADGSYLYTPPQLGLTDPGITEVFDYTIVDSNGDSSNSTLTINVNGGTTLPTVELSVTPDTGSEADETIFTITATASAAVSGAQTIDLGITGVDVADYDLSDTTITIADGEATGSVTLTAIDDSEDEGDETATVTLDNPSAGLNLGTITTADLVIEDNDVTASNNSPVLDLNDYQTSFLVGGDSVPIADTVGIIDSEDLNLQSASIKLTTRPDGDGAESLIVKGDLPTGIDAVAFDDVTGILELNGTASIEDYQIAIAQIEYTNSIGFKASDRLVEVMVNDGIANSNTAVTTIEMDYAPSLDLDSNDSSFF